MTAHYMRSPSTEALVVGAAVASVLTALQDGASGLTEHREIPKMTRARQATGEHANESENVGLDAEASSSDGSSAEASAQDQISRRAYERFQLRGGEHGRDQDDWLEAERELSKSRDE
jgi:hypothetical protein